jgi:hypothetical protein
LGAILPLKIKVPNTFPLGDTMSDMPSTAIEHFMQRDFVVVREKASAVEAAVQMTKILFTSKLGK